MKKTILACAMATIMCATVSAADYPQIVSGQTVTVTDNTTVYQFIPEETGVLTISSDSFSLYAGTSGSSVLFTSPDHSENDSAPLLSSQISSKGRIYIYRVTEAVPYYFYVDFNNNDLNPTPSFTFEFTPGDLLPQVSDVYPAPNTSSPYNLFTYPELQLFFIKSGDVRFRQTLLSYLSADGPKTAPVDYREIITGEGTRFDFDVKAAIDAVKSEMQDSTIFSLILVDATLDGQKVVGRYVDKEGNIVLDYYYVRLTGVVSVVSPSTFLSFWPENDPDGIITVAFDAPLAPLDKQRDLQVGIFAGYYRDGEDGWAPLEGAPAAIDGNVITVDLCDVRRDTKEPVVTVLISGLLDANMMSIDYFGSGAISFNDLPYKMLAQIDPVFEFTPPAGSLENTEQVELWVNAETLRHLRIETFEFDYSGANQPLRLSAGDFSATPDAVNPDDMIYLVKVPEMVRTATNVTLSAVIYSLDGYDYEIAASYNIDSGVDSVEKEKAPTAIYTLDGRKVKTENGLLHPGIYIIDGKKVVVIK